MADIKQLEKELNSLQEELQRQQNEAARARQAVINENRRNLDKYKNQLRSSSGSQNSAMQAEYEKLLKKYQESVDRDFQLELERTDANYSRLLSDVKRSELLLNQKNQELQDAIEEIKKDVNRRNEGNNLEAKKYLQNATSVFHLIEEKPHEKFTPKRLQIYFNAIKDGQQLYKSGLFEAATAVGISAKAGLERLGYTIDDKVDEWDKQFDLFTLKLSYLETKIQQTLSEWEEYIKAPNNGDKEIRKDHLIDINYWSKGEFALVIQIAKKYQAIVKQVNEVGKESYLKSTESASLDDLKKYISEIEDSDKKLEDLRALYRQRYDASCERADWGEEIIDFFSGEINLEWLEELTGFRRPDETVLSSKDFRDYIIKQFKTDDIKEDTREWLRVVFENASGNIIYVYIVPLEKNQKVQNRIIIHVDYGGPEQPLYSRDIYQHVCEAIQLTEDAEDYINYTADVNELRASGNKTFSETAKDLERMKQNN